MLGAKTEKFKKPNFRKFIVFGSLIASLITGSGLISTGVANALLSNTQEFITKIEQLQNGDISIKDLLKFIIDNSGKGEVCQQAGRQSGEDITGDSSVYDPIKGILGYLLNNEQLCTLGLTGLDLNDIDSLESINFTNEFPVFPGFDRTIIDAVAYYYLESRLVGIVRKLDSSVEANMVSGSEYFEFLNNPNEGSNRLGIVASGQPMPTGHELGIDQRIPYPIHYSSDIDSTPELWSTEGINVELEGYDLPITLNTIINNPDFIVFSYDGYTYELGTLTKERIDSISTNNGFYFVSTFNVTPGISMDDWIRRSLAVYKAFPSILLANINNQLYLLQVTGDAYGSSGSVVDSNGISQSSQALFLTIVTSLGRQGIVSIFDDAQANYFLAEDEDGKLVFQYCLGNSNCINVASDNLRRENMPNPNNPSIIFRES